MAKAPTVEEWLSRLHALRAAPAGPETRKELSRALNSKTNLVVARAATIAGELHLSDLTPELASAFDRFVERSPDKGCAAKTALAKALNLLDAAGGDAGAAQEAFLRGVRHRQYEPTWGGQADVAGELRAVCALGLAAAGYRDVLWELADLLADPDPQARLTAARALVLADQDAGAMLLRLKVLAGDAEPDVIAECLLGTMKIAPAKCLNFVAGFLDDPDGARREAAAAALGASRDKGAFELLRRRWETHIDPAARATVVSALALMRLPEALDFLLAVIEQEHRDAAAAAVKAMRPYRHDAALRARIQAAVATRGEPAVTEAFGKAFDA